MGIVAERRVGGGSGLAARMAFLGAVAGLVSGCAILDPPESGPSEQRPQSRGFSPQVYGVPASTRIVQPGQAVPRGGGVYRVGRSYTVRGRTYHPRHDPSYDEVGVASWYGDDFHGRRTANGEIYNMYALSAAHRTLPMPSYVRVSNLANGRSVVVRVNDRGPFHNNRIIDVSKRVAQLLELKGSGVGRVRVQYVGRAPLDGNDEWLVTTVQFNGRPVAPQQVASIAPVPTWAQARPDPTSAVQMALRDTLVPLPPERPRDAPLVQVASAAPTSLPTPSPAAAPAPVVPSPPPVASAAPPVAAPAPPQQAAPIAMAAFAPPPASPQPLQSALSVGTRAQPTPQRATIYVHVGSYRDAAQAFRLRDQLATRGTAVVDPVNVSGITFHQVRVGPFSDNAAAENAVRAARELGAVGARVTQGG